MQSKSISNHERLAFYGQKLKATTICKMSEIRLLKNNQKYIHDQRGARVKMFQDQRRLKHSNLNKFIKANNRFDFSCPINI